jgi:hypothetical protein
MKKLIFWFMCSRGNDTAITEYFIEKQEYPKCVINIKYTMEKLGSRSGKFFPSYIYRALHLSIFKAGVVIWRSRIVIIVSHPTAIYTSNRGHVTQPKIPNPTL